MKKILFFAFSVMLSAAAVADEGMWVLHKIDPRTQLAMQQLGLKLTADELYSAESGVSLKDAVVDFGDFCSGVVVSKDGLVFTNHHCGFGAIQSLSTTDDDILRNGFVARSYAEERPARDLVVLFLERSDDVTARVIHLTDSVKEDSPEATFQERQGIAMDIVKYEYTEANPNREIRVQSFCGGSEFYVNVYKMYRDIRLVFTPTESLGKFGGDTDNWMWPRQTSDFSVFRIYADKDGNPADYSPENVPLHPKRWAKISLDGYVPGDYCMTIGFPGSTSRYLSSYGITERIEQQNKPRIEVRGMKQDVWTKWMKADRSVGIKYASKFASSSNYWKNSIGMNKALADLGVVAQKQQLEERIQRWVSQDPERQQRFGSMMENLKKNYEMRESAMRNLMYYNECLAGCEIVKLAGLADNLYLAKDSAATEACTIALQDFLADYDVRVDEEATATMLQLLAERVDSAYLPECIAAVNEKFGGDYKAYVHDVFARSIVTKKDVISQMALADSTFEQDPAMILRSDLRGSSTGVYLGVSTTKDNTNYNENLLTQAFLEMEQEQPHYSDANFSMRVSYGIIQDYTAAGQHYQYFTNAQSLLDKAAKQKEIEDYLLEDDIMKLIKKGKFGRYADRRTKQMQLCFLSNNDITGGNSGSPMFNGKGELIGLAFDGNWEAMSGDISFDPALQRCIGVDIRFVLYLIDKWGHADNLIKELGLE